MSPLTRGVKVGHGVVRVVFGLEPFRTEALHERAPEEPNQIPVHAILEHLQYHVCKKEPKFIEKQVSGNYTAS